MYEDWIEQLGGPVAEDRRGLCDELAGISRARAALDAREARVLAVIDGLDDSGAASAAVARSITRCSSREADRRAMRADTLTQLPDAADKLATGALTAEHIDALSRAVEETSPEQVRRSGLIDKITDRPADLAARDTRDWSRRQQTPDQLTQRHRRHHTARRLVIFTGHNDMTVLHGEFDPITGAKLKTRIEAEANRLYHHDGGRDDGSTVRTGEQRRADALTNLVDTTPTSDAHTPRAAPVRNQLILVATANDGEITDPRLIDGTPLPPAVFQRLACGSDLFGAVFSATGDPLWMSRRTRLATDAQLRALIARDRGCVICTAHPSRCEAHHLTWWHPPANGPTDIDNLALVCSHDHHLIHDHNHQLTRNRDGTWRLEPP